MKAVRIDETGEPDVLRLVEMETPRPGPGEALVRIKAAGVNFAETMQREGAYPAAYMGFTLPVVLGSEAAGVVEALGEGVHNPPVGARVAVPLFVAMRLTGGYAEYVACDAALLVPLPDALSFEAATALMVQGLTAHFLVRTTPAEGRSVLVHAAAGGVGSLLVQLAKRAGARQVVATASTPEKLARARGLGADAAVNYADPDWSEQVRAVTDGRGPDIVYDPVGGETSRESLKLLAPQGTLIAFGAMSLKTVSLGEAEITDLIFKNQSLTGFALYALLGDGAGQRALAGLFDLAASGALRVEIGGRYPLARAAEAHRDLRARVTTGKLVLVP